MVPVVMYSVQRGEPSPAFIISHTLTNPFSLVHARNKVLQSEENLFSYWINFTFNWDTTTNNNGNVKYFFIKILTSFPNRLILKFVEFVPYVCWRKTFDRSDTNLLVYCNDVFEPLFVSVLMSVSVSVFAAVFVSVFDVLFVAVFMRIKSLNGRLQSESCHLGPSSLWQALLSLESFLNPVGCHPGMPDTKWHPKTFRRAHLTIQQFTEESVSMINVCQKMQPFMANSVVLER